LNSKSLAISLLLLVAFSPLALPAQRETFVIPSVRIPLNIKDQHASISVSGLLAFLRKDHGINVLQLSLTADLADLQQNLTPLLSSELDKDNPCGDRIAIQNATLSPLDPAALVVVQLHYERWACAKLFGKQQSKRLIGGNAVMQLKLTPAVEQNGAELRLIPELVSIDADGSLGELLRSGNLGELLRDKIRAAILSALQKGANLAATLPPPVQDYATITNAQFKDAGAGRLVAILTGEARITDDQLQALAKQLKHRLPSH
jgi:hypothetical protein